MKMRMLQGVCIAMILVLAGCGTNKKQEDLLNYINEELPKIVDIESAVVAGYGAISGENFTSDEVMLAALKEEVVPNSAQLIALAEAIVPKTKEVKAIHALYVDAINNQHQAFTIIIAAIEEGDSSIIAQANEKLTDARRGMNDFLAELRVYAKKNDVTFQND